MPVSLHINTGWDARSIAQLAHMQGIEPAKTYIRDAVNERLLLAADALLDLIFSGTFEKFPAAQDRDRGVRDLLDSYVPPAVGRQYSRRVSERALLKPKMSLLPSEYFARQIYATFLEDEVGGHSLEWWKAGQGELHVVHGLPRTRGTPWPHSRDLMQKEIGHLPAETISKVVYDNAVRLFGLKPPREGV